MIESSYVNLWELITTVASKDLPNAEKCRKIQEVCGKTHNFGSELSLEVFGTGGWQIKVFHHDSECPNEITLWISPSGNISVTKNIIENGIGDRRTISF